MPTDARENAIVAFYGLISGLGWPLVRRNWPGALALEQMPSALLFDGGEKTRDIVTCEMQVDMEITVDVVVKAASTDVIGAELSSRMAEVKAAVMADETIGGLVGRARYVRADDPILDPEFGGSPVAAVTLTFDVQFTHPETSPYP